MSNFVKLSAKDAGELIAALHEKRLTVLFKFADSGVYRLKAAEKGWGQNILAPRPANLGDSRKDQVVTGNFTIEGEVYFFNAKVRIQKKQIHLQLTGELHKLARRRQDRVPVPAEVPLHLVTKRVGDKLVFLRGILQDLSLKGCRIVLNTSQQIVRPGDTVTGFLRWGARRPISVTGVVRHHKRLNKGRFDQMFGMELTKCDDLMRLQAWLVDLQREEFARS